MKFALGLSALLVSTFCLAAQPDRITGTIDSSETVALAGNVAAQAQPQYDRGPVETSMPMDYIAMQVQPSARQQAALERLLAQQKDPSSPSYHKWLTPEQYADRFALSPNDVQKIATWLQMQGFSLVQTARGRDWIAFSGNAGLVEMAFHTEIHYYEVEGEMHFANATPLSIPKALNGIVAGFRGLHDFSLKPMGIRPLFGLDRFLADIVHPFYNTSFGHALAPGDIATIYDITPLYNAGINGSGQNLVVVGQTDIHLSDIEQFRSNFALPQNDPQVKLVTSDPGFTADEGEADLDLEWSGAVARDATIIYVNSAVSAGGVFNSASYAIDQDLAPVISMSYGGCEQDNAGFIPGNEVTMQKASTEGITFLASSGDSGAAGCDPDTVKSATFGLAVNYPASSPEVTGVGGNEFDEGSGQYWGTSGSNGGTALYYIPEIAWNDTAENGTLSASGGGASSCHSTGCSGGFPKPSWQTGTGVPNDGVRDVPDVAMAASADHDGYLFCSADSGVSCANGVNTSATVGGTSVSTPVFAGIVVLLNQQLGNKPPAGEGNINLNLYKLAQDTGNGIFHDITTGNNKVPCTKGTKDCPNGGTLGYSAGTGYDQVTGLGSVDADLLVTQFNTTSTTTTLTSDTNPAQSGATVTFTATVKGSSSNVPTGTVTFDDGSTEIGTPQSLNSSGVATLPYSGLSVGGHSITAAYGGDNNNARSTSSALIETILGTGTTPLTSFVVAANQGPVPYGTSVTFTATVSPPAATNTVTFIVDGTPVAFATLTAGIATSPSLLLTTGTHSITGLYSGDSTYQSSTSAAIQQIINKASTTTAAPSLSPASVNAQSSGPVVMSAAITPSSGPTGRVNFLVDGTSVGSANVGGSFSYNPSALAAGAHSITAVYQGDTNFNGSTSLASTLNVQGFKIAASPTIVTISAPGQSGTTTLTITPLGGFNQTLTYVCSGLPALTTCEFTASSSTTETVTINTAAVGLLREKPLVRGTGIFYALLLPGFIGLVVPFDRRKRIRGIALAAVLAVSVLWMQACGGGGSGGGGGGGNGGTPTGSSTVTITASTSGSSGALSNQVNITLNVQ